MALEKPIDNAICFLLPVKGQLVSILGFIGHMVSVATMWLFCWCTKAATGDIMQQQEQQKIKLYL